MFQLENVDTFSCHRKGVNVESPGVVLGGRCQDALCRISSILKVLLTTLCIFLEIQSDIGRLGGHAGNRLDIILLSCYAPSGSAPFPVHVQSRNGWVSILG